ncbi:hypothetical protein HDV00_011925 [Rhizophlyctis rosea]|nr:hypothetical protein HDV00_011925 [Rhizophlyctis rosea]
MDYRDPGPSPVIVDIVFRETKTTVRTVEDVSRHVPFTRTEVLARDPEHADNYRKDRVCSTVFEEWDTGYSLAKIQPKRRKEGAGLDDAQFLLVETWAAFNGCTNLCGWFFVEETERTEEEGEYGDDIKINVTSLKPRPSQFSFIGVRSYGSKYPSFGHNESLLAYIEHDDDHDRMILLRLVDQTPIASCRLPETLLHPRIWLTRFNVFLQASNLSGCWVYDLKLNLLYKLPNIDKPEDWMVYAILTSFREWEDMVVFDPMTRAIYPIETPASNMTLKEEAMKRNVEYSRYYFTTIEYPVDGTGERTGAPGVTCHYWRGIEYWRLWQEMKGEKEREEGGSGIWH